MTNRKAKWQSYPLSWRVLLNREVPKIPAKPESDDKKENNDTPVNEGTPVN